MTAFTRTSGRRLLIAAAGVLGLGMAQAELTRDVTPQARQGGACSHLELLDEGVRPSGARVARFALPPAQLTSSSNGHIRPSGAGGRVSGVRWNSPARPGPHFAVSGCADGTPPTAPPPGSDLAMPGSQGTTVSLRAVSWFGSSGDRLTAIDTRVQADLMYGLPDRHRSGDCPVIAAAPQTASYSLEHWAADLKRAARHDRHLPMPIGPDRTYEPHGTSSSGAFQGTGRTADDWTLVAHRDVQLKRLWDESPPDTSLCLQ
jgi:hypothetical protein